MTRSSKSRNISCTRRTPSYCEIWLNWEPAERSLPARFSSSTDRHWTFAATPVCTVEAARPREHRPLDVDYVSGLRVTIVWETIEMSRINQYENKLSTMDTYVVGYKSFDISPDAKWILRYLYQAKESHVSRDFITLKRRSVRRAHVLFLWLKKYESSYSTLFIRLRCEV